jgi:hypothetical protein
MPNWYAKRPSGCSLKRDDATAPTGAHIAFVVVMRAVGR